MAKPSYQTILWAVIMIFALGALVSGCGGGTKEAAKPAEKIVLKFGHIVKEDNSWHKGAAKFKEIVEAKSNGRIVVNLYPNSQLGSERAMIEGIQLGTMDMTITGESLQMWAPKVGIMATPYMIRDAAHMEKVVTGPIGQEIEKEILEKTGLRTIAWFERGPRMLTANKPIKTPDELKGVKIRIPEVPLFMEAWRALGASPTPMAFAEVFTALQQGTIDAQENPYALIHSASLNEVQKYVNKTEHVRTWIYVVIGEKKFQSMPKDLQQIILDAAKEMQKYEHEIYLKDEQTLAADLQKKGMQFIDVDKKAFEDKVKDVVPTKFPQYKELYQRILDTK